MKTGIKHNNVAERNAELDAAITRRSHKLDLDQERPQRESLSRTERVAHLGTGFHTRSER